MIPEALKDLVMIILSQRASQAMEILKKRYEKLFMIISDTGCCGYSNVHVTTNEPHGDYVHAGDVSGIHVYFRPPLDKVISYSKVIIDALPTSIDDSFSLETTIGYRFVLVQPSDLQNRLQP
jgi:uncharacterized protein (DUF779 family)